MSIKDNRLAADQVDIRRLAAPREDAIPNNDLFPAIILPGVLGGENETAAIHELCGENGWGGAWTWQVFDYHHFHPDAFEALAVASGGAALMLGGPEGEEIELAAGDVLILPPGYGHKQVRNSADFRICGAYPPGQKNYATSRESDGYDEAVLKTMRQVPLPGTDPVFGRPLQKLLAAGQSQVDCE